MITFLITRNPGADAMSSISSMLVREKMQGISAWGSGPPNKSIPNNWQEMNDTGGSGGHSGENIHGGSYSHFDGGAGGEQVEVVLVVTTNIICHNPIHMVAEILILSDRGTSDHIEKTVDNKRRSRSLTSWCCCRYAFNHKK
jgi:hypothetical protein